MDNIEIACQMSRFLFRSLAPFHVDPKNPHDNHWILFGFQPRRTMIFAILHSFVGKPSFTTSKTVSCDAGLAAYYEEKDRKGGCKTGASDGHV